MIFIFLKKIFINFFFLATPCIACGILVPNQGLNLCSLQWKHGVLTIGLPWKSQYLHFNHTVTWMYFHWKNSNAEIYRVKNGSHSLLTLLLHLMILIRSSLIILGLAGKASSCNAGDLDLIPGLGRSSGEGKGYPLQYSGLENSMDCIIHGVAKSRTGLSDFHFT